MSEIESSILAIPSPKVNYSLTDFESHNKSNYSLIVDKESVEDIKAIKKDVYYIMLPIVLSLCVISFLLSSLIVCSIPFMKRPMSPTIKLSLSLSTANAAFSLVVFAGTLIHSYLPSVFDIKFNDCLSLTIEALRMGVMLVQVYHLLAVALIHYFGTLRPLQYASRLTSHTLKILLLLLWSIPIIGIFIAFCSIAGQGFLSEGCSNNYFRIHGVNFRYVWTLIYFGPTFLLVMIYVHIFVILNQRRKYLEDTEHRKNLRKNLKTVKTTALIVITFLIGWTPAVLAFLLICKDCFFQISDIRTLMGIFSTTYILIIVKVFVDNFIYALRLPEIRDALRNFRSSILKSFKKEKKSNLSSAFRTSSGNNNCCKSTYVTSLKSSSISSDKGKSFKTMTAVKAIKNSYVTMEMKPLFEKVRTETIAITFSGGKYP
ncbi:UNVERIFIED_CONTAM: hypothetical protein RMT77_010607 [Armadillidium vulgare]